MSASPRRVLLDEIAATLTGELAPFAGALVGSTVKRTIPVCDLLAPVQIAEIFGYLSARLGVQPDRRAVLSIWAGWHFRSVLPALLTANIIFDKTPQVALDCIRFVVAPDFRAGQIVISDEVHSIADDPDRFHRLLHVYLKPLIGLMSERSGLTQRVLWSNAGHVFEGFLRMLPAKARDLPGFASAENLMETRYLPDGTPNPLFRPVRYVSGTRIRRVCCMRYLYPDGKTCGPCPMNFQARAEPSDGRGLVATRPGHGAQPSNRDTARASNPGCKSC